VFWSFCDTAVGFNNLREVGAKSRDSLRISREDRLISRDAIKKSIPLLIVLTFRRCRKSSYLPPKVWC